MKRVRSLQERVNDHNGAPDFWAWFLWLLNKEKRNDIYISMDRIKLSFLLIMSQVTYEILERRVSNPSALQRNLSDFRREMYVLKSSAGYYWHDILGRNAKRRSSRIWKPCMYSKIDRSVSITTTPSATTKAMVPQLTISRMCFSILGASWWIEHPKEHRVERLLFPPPLAAAQATELYIMKPGETSLLQASLEPGTHKASASTKWIKEWISSSYDKPAYYYPFSRCAAAWSFTAHPGIVVFKFRIFEYPDPRRSPGRWSGSFGWRRLHRGPSFCLPPPLRSRAQLSSRRGLYKLVIENFLLLLFFENPVYWPF